VVSIGSLLRQKYNPLAPKLREFLQSILSLPRKQRPHAVIAHGGLSDSHIEIYNFLRETLAVHIMEYHSPGYADFMRDIGKVVRRELFP
jgi:hypothetical protein